MTRLHKSYEISSFKARPEEGEGSFEAVVSVFGNVDTQGDRVMPGAFKKSIKNWQDRGDVVPVLWSHEWADPFAHIGFVRPEDMSEIGPGKAGPLKGGLLVKGHLDIDKPFAKQVYDLLSERRVTEFSFAYDVPAGGESRGKDGANELHELEIIEVGPTLKGANSDTVLVGVKSRLDRAAQRESDLEVFQAAMKLDVDLAKALAPSAFARLEADEAKADPEPVPAPAPEPVPEEKAATKPWHIAEVDGQYCVIKDDDDSTVSCHETREEAEAQLRALYANEKSSSPADGLKAGRVIGAKAAAALKSKIDGAVDEFVAEVNGTATPDDEDEGEVETKALEPGDEKDFARGYLDGSTGRKNAESSTEYVRGYGVGEAERSSVETAEVQALNEKLSELAGA